MSRQAETYDADDSQAVLEETLASGFVLGKKLFKATNGRLMESYSYDDPMPVSPRPAWVSIDESSPEPELAAEAYDRRNGLGRYYGRTVPEPTEALASGLLDALKAAGMPPAAAVIAAPLALLFLCGKKAG